MRKMYIVFELTFILACAIYITGCTPTHTIRGNFLREDQIASVKPQEDTASDILQKLGSPTAQSTFDNSTWYYLGQKTEKRGILDAEVIEDSIIMVTFNDEGTVEDIQRKEAERIDIPYERRKTKTSGNEITAAQQLLGNLGKFNNSAEEQ